MSEVTGRKVGVGGRLVNGMKSQRLLSPPVTIAFPWLGFWGVSFAFGRWDFFRFRCLVHFLDELVHLVIPPGGIPESTDDEQDDDATAEQHHAEHRKDETVDSRDRGSVHEA